MVSCPLKASFSRLLVADGPRFRDKRGPTAISPEALMSAFAILILQNDVLR